MSTYQELYNQHEKKIEKTQLFFRASKSALYRNNWKKYNVNVDKLKGFNGLQSLPYSSANDLRRVWEAFSIEEIILTKNVAFWHCTSGSMGNKKWLPWTYHDYTRSRTELGETLLSFLKPDDIVMSIVLPVPYISGALAYRILESTASIGHPIEQITMSPDYVQDSFGLLLKRQPTAIMCTPSLALRMAEEIARNTPKVLKRQAELNKSAKLKIASLITKIKKIKPKRVFKNLRVGFFFAESLRPFRKVVEDQYSIEAFDIYAFTEGFGVGYECQEHNGLHFPSLNCVLEIIPEKELEKEQENPDYIPKAILLSEASKGLKGEIVISDFKEALPLLRYRVRDMIEVIAEDECGCGANSPRLKIIGRTDDIINLGVIRFSSAIVQQYLSREFKNGVIHRWDMVISREGFKPKLSLRIEPGEIKNEEKFKEELFTALYDFDVFQIGYDSELFIFDEIEFVDNLKLGIVGQGKTKRVKYHPNFFKEVKM
ncbi:phenylacetate--CoA ligase family protein [Candidatus Heimdallarchaeota archaeon]|nr:MAG: phenylacetate--CoA ligase family protein [Candidatus Heimdallarchaeota archaeon]